MQKFRAVSLGVVALLAIVLSGCATLTGSGDPNVAATVNGTDVPVTEVEERYEQAKEQPQVAQQLEADTEGAFESQLQAQILTQLVLSELLEQWADELGIEATEEEVEQEREDLVEQLGGQDAFDQAVAESGLTDEDVTLQIRQRVLQNKIADSVASDVEVTDEQVEQFYAENAEARYGGKATARHILVEEEAKANRLMKQLRDGADFAELAEKESTDTGSAQQGGELGEFGRGQMVPPFEEAVFNAEVGDLVGPVQTEFGFHIIEVLDKTEPQELEEVRDEIETELADTREGELLQERLQERTSSAEVTVNPRFGTWNPETGQVEPSKPLGDTSDAPVAPSDPAGGTAPGGTATELPPLPSEVPTQ